MIHSLQELLACLKEDFGTLFWYMGYQTNYYSKVSYECIKLDLDTRRNIVINIVPAIGDKPTHIRFRYFRELDLVEFRFIEYDSLFTEITNSLMMYGYKTGFHRNQLVMDLYDKQNMEGR